jgi:hypothetical protein
MDPTPPPPPQEYSVNLPDTWHNWLLYHDDSVFSRAKLKGAQAQLRRLKLRRAIFHRASETRSPDSTFSDLRSLLPWREYFFTLPPLKRALGPRPVRRAQSLVTAFRLPQRWALYLLRASPHYETALVAECDAYLAAARLRREGFVSIYNPSHRASNDAKTDDRAVADFIYLALPDEIPE